MTSGCYVLHVYCDALACSSPNKHCDRMQEFTGQIERDAIGAAKKAGWRIAPDGYYAWCPEHADRPLARRMEDRKAARCSQIGQAMPPPLAEAVARSVVEQDEAAKRGAA